MEPGGNVTLRLPASLKAAAEAAAKAGGITLDQFIAMAVAEKVAALRTADYRAARAKRANFEAFDRFMSRDTDAPPRPDDVICRRPLARCGGGRVLFRRGLIIV